MDVMFAVCVSLQGSLIFPAAYNILIMFCRGRKKSNSCNCLLFKQAVTAVDFYRTVSFFLLHKIFSLCFVEDAKSQTAATACFSSKQLLLLTFTV